MKTPSFSAPVTDEHFKHLISVAPPPKQSSDHSHHNSRTSALFPTRMEHPGGTAGIHVSPSAVHAHSDISGTIKQNSADSINPEAGLFLPDGTYIDPTVLIQYTDPHTTTKVNIADTLTSELLVSEPSTILMQEIPGMEHDDGYSEKAAHFPFYTTSEHVMQGGGFYPHGYFATSGFPTVLSGSAATPNGPIMHGSDWHYSNLEGGLSPGGHDAENNNNPSSGGIMDAQKQQNCNSLNSPNEKGQLPPIQGSILAIEDTTPPGATTAVDVSLVNQMQAYVSGKLVIAVFCNFLSNLELVELKLVKYEKLASLV